MSIYGNNDNINNNDTLVIISYNQSIFIFRNMNAAGLPRWNEYDTTNEHYMNFDVPITTGQHLYKDRSKFWLSDIPAILQGDTSTASRVQTEQIIQMSVYCIIVCISFILLA